MLTSVPKLLDASTQPQLMLPRVLTDEVDEEKREYGEKENREGEKDDH